MDVYRTETRYALLIRLPRAVEVLIEDRFLHEIGATRPVMGYHITLLGPFRLREGRDASVLHRAAQVCQRWPAFEVRIAGLGTFEVRDRNTLFVPALSPERLVALHGALRAALEDDILLARDPAEGYQPHVTLGIGLLDADLPALFRDDPAAALDVTFVVQEVWLAVQPPNAPWRHLARYPLGAAAPAEEPPAY